jgi:hypothetical protein
MLHPIEFGLGRSWDGIRVPVGELCSAEVLLVFWLAERNVAACQ